MSELEKLKAQNAELNDRIASLKKLPSPQSHSYQGPCRDVI